MNIIDTLAAGYLDALERAARDLPRTPRRELTADIRSHVEEARSRAETPADMADALDRLGDPDEIVAAERERLGVEPARGGTLEWISVVLLLIGGVVVPILGWFAGVVLLWGSRVWTLRDKLLGTLLVPGGLALPLFLGVTAVDVQSCSGPVGGELTCTGGRSDAEAWLAVALLAFSVIAPLATSVYLIRRARRPAV
jgi:hypothetical protein